ncbi:MAG: hypothetical protein EKK41_21175 [Hyphomicrobiales bacterium]|nr:MAG: hypothetical protein EKK41_21175 [Hyphomicrobiales bacterium]
MRVLEGLHVGAAVEAQAFLLWALAANASRMWPDVPEQEAIERAFAAVRRRAVEISRTAAARAGYAPLDVQLQ